VAAPFRINSKPATMTKESRSMQDIAMLVAMAEGQLRACRLATCDQQTTWVRPFNELKDSLA
jgi:hypothetical protein